MCCKFADVKSVPLVSNSVLLSLLPSSFVIFYLSSTPDEDYVSKALVVLIVLYVSSCRWVHFSRAVLFCQPHQQLFHSVLLSVNDSACILVTASGLYPSASANIFRRPVPNNNTNRELLQDINDLLQQTMTNWSRRWPTAADISDLLQHTPMT